MHLVCQCTSLVKKKEGVRTQGWGRFNVVAPRRPHERPQDEWESRGVRSACVAVGNLEGHPLREITDGAPLATMAKQAKPAFGSQTTRVAV